MPFGSLLSLLLCLLLWSSLVPDIEGTKFTVKFSLKDAKDFQMFSFTPLKAGESIRFVKRRFSWLQVTFPKDAMFKYSVAAYGHKSQTFNQDFCNDELQCGRFSTPGYQGALPKDSYYNRENYYLGMNFDRDITIEADVIVHNPASTEQSERTNLNCQPFMIEKYVSSENARFKYTFEFTTGMSKADSSSLTEEKRSSYRKAITDIDDWGAGGSFTAKISGGGEVPGVVSVEAELGMKLEYDYTSKDHKTNVFKKTDEIKNDFQQKFELNEEEKTSYTVDVAPGQLIRFSQGAIRCSDASSSITLRGSATKITCYGENCPDKQCGNGASMKAMQSTERLQSLAEEAQKFEETGGKKADQEMTAGMITLIVFAVIVAVALIVGVIGAAVWCIRYRKANPQQAANPPTGRFWNFSKKKPQQVAALTPPPVNSPVQKLPVHSPVRKPPVNNLNGKQPIPTKAPSPVAAFH